MNVDHFAANCFDKVEVEDGSCGGAFFVRQILCFSLSSMYRRPATNDEGIGHLRKRLDATRHMASASKTAYGVFWKAGDFLMNGTFCDNMLRPLCESSEITSFLFKMACPIVEEILCTPDDCDKRIDAALKDEKAMLHVQEAYDLLQDLIKSADVAMQRTDIDEALQTCAKEVVKLTDNTYVCEAIRLLSMSNFSARVCIRVGIPRMTHSLKHDKGLESETMTPDVLAQFAR